MSSADSSSFVFAYTMIVICRRTGTVFRTPLLANSSSEIREDPLFEAASGTMDFAIVIVELLRCRVRIVGRRSPQTRLLADLELWLEVDHMQVVICPLVASVTIVWDRPLYLARPTGVAFETYIRVFFDASPNEFPTVLEV